MSSAMSVPGAGAQSTGRSTSSSSQSATTASPGGSTTGIAESSHLPSATQDPASVGPSHAAASFSSVRWFAWPELSQQQTVAASGLGPPSAAVGATVGTGAAGAVDEGAAVVVVAGLAEGSFAFSRHPAASASPESMIP